MEVAGAEAGFVFGVVTAFSSCKSQVCLIILTHLGDGPTTWAMLEYVPKTCPQEVRANILGIGSRSRVDVPGTVARRDDELVPVHRAVRSAGEAGAV
jgi:hypothetical protein